MDHENFISFIDTILQESKVLLETRAAEYASYEDHLSNFKQGAALTGCTAQQVAFIYLSKHYSAVAAYVREGGSPLGAEPIRGRLTDLLNYVILLAALIHEEADQ